jgi:hypothetical protein
MSRPRVVLSGHKLRAVARLAGAAGRRSHVSVACSASLRGRHLRVVVNAFGHGAARCAWRIPPRAHGRVNGYVRVRGSVALVRRSFTTTLR